MTSEVRGTHKAQVTRQRLIQAAQTLFHHQGISGTSLADIAQASGVPLGNVHYHFRTKDELIAAVVAHRRQELAARFEAARAEPSALERLKLLVQDGRRNRADLVAHGCPFAALTQDSVLAQGQLFELYLDFATEQFEQLGWGTAARDLAEEFVVLLQGSFLLANGTLSAAFLDRQLTRLEGWLDRIGSARTPVMLGSVPSPAPG